MSSKLAGTRVTPRPTASPLNRPRRPSWESGVGWLAAASWTFCARSANSEPQGLSGPADDLVIRALPADVVVGRDRGQDRDADGVREGLGLAGAVVLVDDEAADADVAAELAEVFHRRADVVRHIERLEVVRADDDDLLAHVPRDRQAEAAADHVAEEVEEDVVEAPFVEAELLQEFEAVDDAAPAAAAPDLGAAELHRVDPVALEADVADGDLLAGELLLRGGLDDGGAGTSAEEERGGVALRVAADEEHLLALLGHHVAEVGQGERLADAALAVDRDDLRLLGRLHGHGIRLDAGLRPQGLGGRQGGAAHLRRLHRNVHAALQSRIIFRHPGSPKAVR